MFSDSEKAVLKRLLDDPSDAVRTSLQAHFMEREEDALAFLRELMNDRRSGLAWYARQYLDRIGVDDTVQVFREFIRSFSYELETGSWLLDRTVFPRMDATVPGAVLDAMAGRVMELMIEPSSDIDKCRLINRVMFHEYGFRGDLEEFRNPESSFLSRVVERRKGIPISLSIVYILVATRCGIDLRPVGIPGRFMVGCFSEDRPVFIDVFEGGRFLSVADVLIFLETNRIPYDEGPLSPIPVGELLCRSCRNLNNQYRMANDLVKASLFEEFVMEFQDAYRREHQS